MNAKRLTTLGRGLIGLALAATVLAGLWLRWMLAGTVPLVRFGFIRHAHAHMGYYGVLFPLAWLAWARLGAKMPGYKLFAIYAIATAGAFVGFVTAGYAVVAIASSTVIAVVWIITAWHMRHHMKELANPLGTVFLGTLLAEVCIPPVAIFLDSDPALARGFVATFLSMLLLLVIIPSALALHKARPGPWPVLLISGVLGCLFMGLWAHPITRLGLAVYGIALGVGAWRSQLVPHLRLVWTLLAVGLVVLASGLLPLQATIVIGGVHFMVLAPVVGSLSEGWLRKPLHPLMWLSGYGTVSVMSGALVAQGLGIPGPTRVVAAVGGSLIVTWWAVVLVIQLRARSKPLRP